jgi:hypothetical protein
MRFGKLRRVLQEIVLVGLPASQVGCGVFDECVESRRRTVDVGIPAEPEMQFRIDRCDIDVETCPALCELAMERALGLTPDITACQVTVLDDRALVDVTYNHYNGGGDCPVEGRRPAGLATPVPGGRASAAGAWLAHAAWLEAASVHAFAHLARELAHHGAPRNLIRGAQAAACDEVRHTALMARLALRYGARPATAVVAPPATRPLADLAIENAAEGCVRETWGAVVALWQSHTARDPIARETFRVIAHDEARHAALAWAIDRWVQPRLDAADIARVVAARTRAAQELRAEHAGPAIVAIGLPHGPELHGLVTRADRALWSGGAS